MTRDRSLAERGVNILAFQAYERDGQSLIRMMVDDPASGKKVLDADRITTPKRRLRRVRFHIARVSYPA